MRQSTLAISSLALVGLAVAAIADAARAQDVPVVYRTDPGPAHPRYSEKAPAPMRVAAVAAPEAEAAAYMAETYEGDPIARISPRGTVTVEAGDTVYALARRYGVSPNSIIRANALSAPYALDIGQEIMIPDIAPAAQTAQAGSMPVARVNTAAGGLSEPVLAVVEPTPAPERLDAVYTVRHGDTLYSLSRQFGIDLATLAEANDLSAPYALSVDQRVIIPGAIENLAPTSEPKLATVEPSAVIETAPVYEPEAPTAKEDDVEPILVSKTPDSRFAWPLRGAVVMGYGMTSAGVRNDGINIAAPVGAPVRAAADGEVVYTGSELEGYGNLLLVRHEDGWVSAYAHTDSILVSKGDKVRQGQVVAKVGDSGAVDQPQLHFELRHELKPRDPLAALNGQDFQARAISVSNR